MRQRLTPEIVCSTTTRAPEKIVLMNFSLMLNSLPLGFFGLPGQDSGRLIPLKARVFVERGVVWIDNLRGIRGLLIVGCARHGWTQIQGIRLRWDSGNMTAVTQKCTACPSPAATALEA